MNYMFHLFIQQQLIMMVIRMFDFDNATTSTNGLG
jgi:hypothetical protein